MRLHRRFASWDARCYCVQNSGGVLSSIGTIRVALIEDDRLTREGLSALIDGSREYLCVASFGSVEEALSADLAPPPDVILLDIHLPGMSGTEGVRPLLDRYPGSVILMLTVFEEQDKVFRSLCNGAVGYLLKRTPPARLLEAIREAKEGGSPMSPDIARTAVSLLQKFRPPAESFEELTARETRLLSLLAEGYSYESAGLHLNVSVNTVRNYVRSIYSKLHVHSKSEAVSRALRSGLV